MCYLIATLLKLKSPHMWHAQWSRFPPCGKLFAQSAAQIPVATLMYNV